MAWKRPTFKKLDNLSKALNKLVKMQAEDSKERLEKLRKVVEVHRQTMMRKEKRGLDKK
jgi:hypothetical protein